MGNYLELCGASGGNSERWDSVFAVSFASLFHDSLGILNILNIDGFSFFSHALGGLMQSRDGSRSEV